MGHRRHDLASHHRATAAVLASLVGASLACGGGAPAVPVRVDLPGCEPTGSAPGAEAPAVPTLQAILEGTPASYSGPRDAPKVRATVGGASAQLTQASLMGASPTTFDLFRDSGNERVSSVAPTFLVLHVVAHPPKGRLFLRTPELTVTLGAATIVVTDDRTIDRYLFVPGVVFAAEDLIAYDVEAGAPGESTAGAHAEIRWGGVFPIALGDASTGIEVRALSTPQVTDLVNTRLAALDAAFPLACADATVTEGFGPAYWDLRTGPVADGIAGVAEVVGWQDPRLLARLARRDELMDAWSRALQRHQEEAAADAVPVGDAVTTNALEVTIDPDVHCEAGAVDDWCAATCAGSMRVSGAPDTTTELMLSPTVLLGSGRQGPVTTHPPDAGSTAWTFSACLPELPPDGDPLLVQFPRADRWSRLR